MSSIQLARPVSITDASYLALKDTGITLRADHLRNERCSKTASTNQRSALHREPRGLDMSIQDIDYELDI